jgi:spectinomycin phosphotransferase
MLAASAWMALQAHGVPRAASRDCSAVSPQSTLPDVFTRPFDLTDEQVVAELAVGWGFHAATCSYLPVGFGSHHWLATDAAGGQLFLIVHDLHNMLRSRTDTADAAFGRLQTALRCAVSLRRDADLDFVVAPVPAVDGDVLRRLSLRYTLAACPYLTDCEAGREREFPGSDLPAVVRLLARLHRARPAVAPQRCDFALPNADGLRAALASTSEPWDGGPYGERARAMLTRHAASVVALMAAYGQLVSRVSGRPDRFVLTHGEPDAWNVLKTPAGFVVVDWDFTQLAPPERDLWHLAETDHSVFAAYTEASGILVDGGALALFRMGYDLADIAEYVCLFRGQHDDTEDAARSWENLEYFLRRAELWRQIHLPAL